MLWLVRGILNIVVCKILFRVKYINNNLERNIDKCIICPNHISVYDPIYIFVNSRKIATMGKAELFRNKILNKLFRHLGGFPIERGKKDAKALIHAVNILKNDTYKRLTIFPEGTRVKSEQDSDAKIGAIYIAMKADVPILPVRIIKKNPDKKLFTSVKVIYGAPIYFDKARIKDKEYLKEMSDKLMNDIYDMED